MQKHRISIWFFIGLLLTVYGMLILGAGIYGLSHPPRRTVQMEQYHAGIWWGVLLLLLGLFYTIKFRPKKEQ